MVKKKSGAKLKSRLVKKKLSTKRAKPNLQRYLRILKKNRTSRYCDIDYSVKQRASLCQKKILWCWSLISKTKRIPSAQKISLKRGLLFKFKKRLTALHYLSLEMFLVSTLKNTSMEKKFNILLGIISAAKLSPAQKLTLKTELAKWKLAIISRRTPAERRSAPIVPSCIVPNWLLTMLFERAMVKYTAKVRFKRKIITPKEIFRIKTFWEQQKMMNLVDPKLLVVKTKGKRRTIKQQKIKDKSKDWRKKKRVGRKKRPESRGLRPSSAERLQQLAEHNKRKAEKLAELNNLQVKQAVKLDVPIDIYTLPVGTEQKKWLQKHNIVSLSADIKKIKKRKAVDTLNLVKAGGQKGVDINLKVKGKIKQVFPNVSKGGFKLRVRERPVLHQVKITKNLSKKNKIFSFLSLKRQLRSGLDRKLFVLLKSILKKQLSDKHVFSVQKKVVSNLLRYWFFMRWKRYFLISSKLGSYLRERQQRFLVKKLQKMQLSLNKKLSLSMLNSFLSKIIHIQQNRSAKMKKQKANKKLTVETYYHWIQGWDRFRRIRDKISNSGSFRKIMNRNFSKGRRFYCIHFVKSFWGEQPITFPKKKEKVNFSLRKFNKLFLSKLIADYLKLRLKQSNSFLTASSNDAIEVSVKGKSVKVSDAMLKRLVRKNKQRHILAFATYLKYVKQYRTNKENSIRPLFVFNKLKMLKQWSSSTYNLRDTSKVSKSQFLYNRFNKCKGVQSSKDSRTSLITRGLANKKLQKKSFSNILEQLATLKAKRDQARLDRVFLQLAEASRIVVFYTNRNSTVRASLRSLNDIWDVMLLQADLRKVYSANVKCSWLAIILSYLWQIFRKRKKLLRRLMIKKKKKFFLVKYQNLIYSLQLSTYLDTSIRCFFISCLSLLFFKRKGRKKFKKMYRILNARTISYGRIRKLQTIFLKRFNFIFFLSFKFKQFHLFLDYIKFLFIKFSRRQFVAVGFFKAFLKKGFINFAKNLIGLQFSFKGKMNRRPRARRILMLKKRKPPFQDLQLKVLYYAKEVITYFGAYMFRLWIYYY